jgi:hypothetical protein
MLERNVGKVNLDNARVVVANLTVVGHLPYLVQALEHAGLLHKWYVGAYPKKLSRGILSLPRIRGRRKVDINDDKIQNYWWFELLRGSAARLSARHFEFYESIRLYCLEQFGRSVANEIRREKPDIVIGTN